MGGDELKATSSDYLGITIPPSELTDTYGLMNGNDMLPPILKKTAGAMSTKRKKSSSETATTSNAGHSCSLCNNKGHKINNCPISATLGIRLTVSKWHDRLALIPHIDDIQFNQIDPVVPSDARGLQIVGKVGVIGDYLVGVSVVFRVNVVLGDLTIKSNIVCHLTCNIVGQWCTLGKSTRKLVFVKI